MTSSVGGARPKTVAVVQARMGSARLPGKILAQVSGLPMLELILRRVGSSRSVDRLIVATTRLPEDDRVPVLTKHLGVECFRGDTDDCLGRIHDAVAAHAPEVVVRLTGDNPLPDGEFVDWVLEAFFAADPPYDYIDTMTHGTFPYGLSVEALTFDALSAAWHETRDASDREHVTQFIRRNPERFRHRALGSERDDHAIRVTVDYPADLEYVNQLFAAAGRWSARWQDLIELARTRPRPASAGQAPA